MEYSNIAIGLILEYRNIAIGFFVILTNLRVIDCSRRSKKIDNMKIPKIPKMGCLEAHYDLCNLSSGICEPILYWGKIVSTSYQFKIVVLIPKIFVFSP